MIKKYFILIIFCIIFLSCGKNNDKKIPIIYTEKYNISFLGIEKLHSFDTHKYEKIFNYLNDKFKLNKNSYYKPQEAALNDLLIIHSKKYLDSLNNPKNIAKIAEVDILSKLPKKALQESLLKPIRYGVGGTLLGVKLALKYKWAINLSGGFHHCKAEKGGGFCFYADVPIAVYQLWKDNPKLRVLIVDLDAHQGNGYQDIFKNDDRVFMLDIYNSDIYPHDESAKKYIDFNCPVKSNIKDTEYLRILDGALKTAVKKSKPGIIIYLAGTDIYQNDPLGKMKISETGIIKRDEMVFKYAFKNSIPILMLLSGGYSKKSGLIIGKSIEKLLNNIILINK